MLLRTLQGGKGRAGRAPRCRGPGTEGGGPCCGVRDPTYKGSCYQQISPVFILLARFKVFEERDGGPSKVNKVRTPKDMPRQDQAASCIQHPQPRGCGSACSKDTSSFCHGPLQKAQRSISEQRRGPLTQRRLVFKGATSPHKHPSSTVPSSILPPNRRHGVAEGLVPARHPQPAASPPFELVSSSLSAAARGKFGLGWGTLLRPAREDDRTGVLPCRWVGRKHARREMRAFPPA